MSLGSNISLINLGQQLTFEIDDVMKTNICFAETLVVSCAHHEGVFEDKDGSGSEFTCSETTESTVDDEIHEERPPTEIKTFVPEPEEDEDQQDDDFHTFFFPDCKGPKPTAQHSEMSFMTVDGWPVINPAAQKPRTCTCREYKKDRDKCDCFTKLPCKCGAKKLKDCICGTLETICICDVNKPNPKCPCHKAHVCTCFPGLPQPFCSCENVDKPCVCYPGKAPKAICDCKFKPTFGYLKALQKPYDENLEEEKYQMEGMEEGESNYEGGYETVSNTLYTKSEVAAVEPEEPCICQKPTPDPCLCLKGKECKCKLDACICGVQKNCICEPVDSKDAIVCKSDDSKSICSCPEPRECTCDAKENGVCKCFPKPITCNCGNPANCRCKLVCECADPCICDTSPVKEEECVCLDRIKKKEGFECQCICKKKHEQPKKKLKKVRAGKHGYRWCHDVDPHHTYFDYGYGRHDKIDYKEQEREKFKILGLYQDEDYQLADGKCPVHDKEKLPQFEKKVRKPSIDCCSAVGGISMNVECLGEEKDRFLIQVVSHFSKEGAKTGSKLISIVDCNLHTMEENRIEHITKNGVTKERRSYMAVCENGYYNKITRTCGDSNVVKRFYHSFDIAHDFLLEGSNVVLLRYLALRRHHGKVKTLTVLMDGTICESIYVCLGVGAAIVNGKSMYVARIERHIIEPSGFMHQTLTILTLRGYIVSHEWADTPYMFHLNPLLNIVPEKDEVETHAPLRETWRKDLQLLSDYLDYKSMRSSEGARYIAENGELTDTVRDYLQAVLLLKPADVVHFTKHYFQSAIAALDLPHDEYFDPCPKHVRYFYFEE